MAIGLILLVCGGGIGAVGVAIVVLVINLRRGKPLPETSPLAPIAARTGLRYSGGKLVGVYREHHLTIELLPVRADRPGIAVTAQAKHPLNGEIQLSGPSENAGTGTPEVKILVGNGAFDYHFWVIKSDPRDLAKSFFGARDDLCQRMVADAPFGRWALSGKTLSFSGYDSPTLPLSEDTNAVQTVADILVEIADELEEQHG